MKKYREVKTSDWSWFRIYWEDTSAPNVTLVLEAKVSKKKFDVLLKKGLKKEWVTSANAFCDWLWETEKIKASDPDTWKTY